MGVQCVRHVESSGGRRVRRPFGFGEYVLTCLPVLGHAARHIPRRPDIFDGQRQFRGGSTPEHVFSPAGASFHKFCRCPSIIFVFRCFPPGSPVFSAFADFRRPSPFFCGLHAFSLVLRISVDFHRLSPTLGEEGEGIPCSMPRGNICAPARHSTTPHDTARHICTTQHDTARHSTTQHDTARRIFSAFHFM